MVTAMTTGHEGSLSTLHASSPADAVRRVQTLLALASAIRAGLEGPGGSALPPRRDS